MNPLFQRIACAFGLLLALLAPSAHAAIGGLIVKCNMEGARVLLDGVDKGTCPAKLFTTPGTHTLEVNKPIDSDYVYFFKTQLNLPDGEPQKIDAELKKVYTEDGWYRRGNDDEYLQTFPFGRYAKTIHDKRRQAEQERQAAITRAKQERAEAIREGKPFNDCDVCPELVVIPAGSYQMGSNDNDSEKPLHSVGIKRFALGKYEVTQGQWQAVMGSNPSAFKSCGDTCPVEQVSWDDIQQYIQKLNAKTGQQYRLPSEAEWEYAARGGAQSQYWWGDTASHEYANYGKDECCGGLAQGRDRWENTAPVGRFPANAFGLHDMHGNVWEWVQDYDHDSYSGAPTDGSGWESGGEQKDRVLRGGSYNAIAAYLRLAYRSGATPDYRSSIIGFRLARTLLTP